MKHIESEVLGSIVLSIEEFTIVVLCDFGMPIVKGGWWRQPPSWTTRSVWKAFRDELESASDSVDAAVDLPATTMDGGQSAGPAYVADEVWLKVTPIELRLLHETVRRAVEYWRDDFEPVNGVSVESAKELAEKLAAATTKDLQK